MTTLLVALVIASTKFLAGAWIVVVLIPLLVVLFLGISHHYRRVERELTTSLPLKQEAIRHRLIVPIASLNPAARFSLAYARSISRHVTVAHITIDLQDAEMVRSKWERLQKHLTQEGETQLVAPAV